MGWSLLFQCLESSSSLQEVAVKKKLEIPLPVPESFSEGGKIEAEKAARFVWLGVKSIYGVTHGSGIENPQLAWIEPLKPVT